MFAKFETQLKSVDGNLRKAAVELAKEWRTDRYLRRLEAQLIVGDGESMLVLSGEGDVIEPDDGIAAIGSGAPYATAAAKALMAHTELPAREIVESAMGIAAELCIFTNDRIHDRVGRAPPDAGDGRRRSRDAESDSNRGRRGIGEMVEAQPRSRASRNPADGRHGCRQPTCRSWRI